MTVTPPSSRRDGDHRVVLDVQLLLVADPVLALEDEVGGGEGRVEVAALDRVRRRRRGRDASGSKTGGERRRPRRRPAGAPRAASPGPAAARSASGSAWCWISPPIGTRIGWSSLIELTMFSPGMSAAVTTTTFDQSKAGSSSSASKRGVRVGRADRRAVPGARARRCRRCTWPCRSAWPGPRGGAARPDGRDRGRSCRAG